jgi:hypothetical protein
MAAAVTAPAEAKPAPYSVALAGSIGSKALKAASKNSEGR